MGSIWFIVSVDAFAFPLVSVCDVVQACVSEMVGDSAVQSLDRHDWETFGSSSV